MPIQHWALNMLGYWYTVWKYNLILFHFYLPHTKVVLRSGQRDKSTVVNTTEYYIFFLRSLSFFFLNTSRYLFGATRIFLPIHEVDIQMLHVQLMVWLFFVFEVVALLWLPRELPQELSIFLWLFFIGNDFDDDE